MEVPAGGKRLAEDMRYIECYAASGMACNPVATEAVACKGRCRHLWAART